MNPQMFNSFLDGTKSAIESAATSNATGLLPPANGLLFLPPTSTRCQRCCGRWLMAAYSPSVEWSR